MKHVSILFFMVAILFSCKEKRTEDFAIISGTIKNAKNDIIKVTNNNIKNHNLEHIPKAIKLDGSGHFYDTIYSPKNQYYKIEINKKPIATIYLEKGYVIDFTANEKDLTELLITGKGSDINNFLAFEKKIRKEWFTSFKLGEARFLDKNDSIKALKINKLEKITDVNEDVLEIKKKDVEYENIWFLYNYEKYYKIFNNSPNFKVSNSFPDVVSQTLEILIKTSAHKEQLFNDAPNYRYLTYIPFNEKAKKVVKEKNVSYPVAMLSLIKEEAKGKNQIEYLIDGLTRYFDVNKKEQTENLYQGMLQLISDESFKSKMTRSYKKAMNKVVTVPIIEKAKKMEKEKNIPYSIALLNTIKTDTRKGTQRDYFLKEIASYFNGTEPELSKNLYQGILKISTNDSLNKDITRTYKKIMKLTKGSPSPKFENYENYLGGANSLADFKGKYVYIDLWATWCTFCLKEVPYLEKIEKEYHAKNIAFVSISIDKEKDYEKWRKMIADKEMKGVQLLADNNNNSKFYTDYEIKSLPRFILIDPEGNIVSADAPRPSNPKLKELFNSLKI